MKKFKSIMIAALLLLSIASVFQFIGVAFADTIILQQTSYNTSYYLQKEHPSNTADRSAVSQTFRYTGGSSHITIISLVFSKFGSPTENLTVHIYANDSNGLPTGASLATSTSINMTSMGASAAWYNFTISFDLPINTWYCFDVEVNGGGLIDTTSNYVQSRTYSTSLIEGIAGSYYGSAWHSGSPVDMAFIVYGQDTYVWDTGSASSTYAGLSCTFSNYFLATAGVSGSSFATNITSVWVNDTWSAFTNPINATASWFNVTKTLPVTVGQIVGYKWWGNDTNNNWNSSSIYTLTTTAQPGLSGFRYRQAHALSSSTTLGPNYQVKIICMWGNGTSSGDVCYLDEHARTDFGDVRFTDGDGTTELDYWQEEGAVHSGINSTFWVEVADTIPTTIFVYYGNSTATTTSNGLTTFVFFDDFNAASLNLTKWVAGGDDWGVENGYAYVRGFYISTYGWIYSEEYFAINHALEMRAAVSQTNFIGPAETGYVSVWWTWAFGGFKFTTPFRATPLGGTYFAYGGDSGYLQGYGEYATVYDTNWHRSTSERYGSTIGDLATMDGETHTSPYATDETRKVGMIQIYGNTAYLRMDWCAVRMSASTGYSDGDWSQEWDSGDPLHNMLFEITDLEGCGNWVFAQSKYYHFKASFYHNYSYSDIDTGMVYFADGTHNITIAYNQAADKVSIVAGTAQVRLQHYGVESLGGQLNITFGVYFTQDSTDSLNIDVKLWMNDTSGNVIDWFTIVSDYFNIYSIGGQVDTSSSGTAGRRTGGEAFDLYCHEGSTVEANQTFRNLQHIKLLEYQQCVTAGQYFNVTYSLDYCDPTYGWVHGLSVVLEANDITAGSQIYINFTAHWYFNDTLISSEFIYFYVYNGTAVGTQATTKYWVDFWFNRVNGSTTIAGRISAYEYPMKDSANAWIRWLSGSSWGADEALSSTSMRSYQMSTRVGNIPLPRSDIKLVMFRMNITIGSGTAQDIEFLSTPVNDLTLGSYPVSGIQTPTFEETKLPKMEQGGLMGALFSFFGNLWASISSFMGPVLLTFFDVFVGWLDTLFGWFGFPHLFSDFMAWMTTGWTFVVAGFVWLSGLMVSGLTFLTSIMSSVLGLITSAVDTAVQFVTWITSLFTGGVGIAGNIWVDYQMSTWITLFFIFYPIYLVVLWDQEGLDAVISQLTFIFGMISMLVTGIISVISLFISAINALVESIPVVE